MGYDAREVAKWGIVDWLSNKGEAPLVDMVFNASADMVDYNLAIMFQSQHCSSNYLRIQVSPAFMHFIHSLHRIGRFKGADENHPFINSCSFLALGRLHCMTPAFVHKLKSKIGFD